MLVHPTSQTPLHLFVNTSSTATGAVLHQCIVLQPLALFFSPFYWRADMIEHHEYGGRLISDKYIWPCVSKDIRLWCRQCIFCQYSKMHRHTKPSIGLFPVDQRFETAHIDLIDSMKPSADFLVYWRWSTDILLNWIMNDYRSVNKDILKNSPFNLVIHQLS